MFIIDGKKPTEQERMKTDKITANLKFLKVFFRGGAGLRKGIQSASERTGKKDKSPHKEKTYLDLYLKL